MSVQMCKNTENWPEKEFVCDGNNLCEKYKKKQK